MLRSCWLLTAVILASGCASITGGETQPIRVATIQSSGEEVFGADCRLTNDKGEWRVVTPGEVQVRRSNNSLTAVCEKKPFAPGHASIASATRDAMYGNLLVGGLIGIAIDHSSGAGYEYSPHASIVMGSFSTILTAPPSPPSGRNRIEHEQQRDLPEASGFADYRDVTAIPIPKARAAYRDYLSKRYPRAFALGNAGGNWASGSANAVARAMSACVKRFGECRLYAYDDVVVWRAEDAIAIASAPSTVQAAAAQKPAPRRAPAPAEPSVITSSPNRIPAEHIFEVPAESGFAKLSDPYALPFVDVTARERFQQRYLILRSPKAFAIGARGQWQYLANDPRSMKTILERCEASNKGTCWLYAVDDRVVWSDDPEKRISIDKLKLRQGANAQMGVEP